MYTSGASLGCLRCECKCECLVTSNFYYIYARWSLPPQPLVSPVGTYVHQIALVFSRCILCTLLRSVPVHPIVLSRCLIVCMSVRAYFSHPQHHIVHLTAPIRAPIVPLSSLLFCSPIQHLFCFLSCSISAPVLSVLSAFGGCSLQTSS